jgi:Ca2+:H+ antiporter
MVKKLLYGMLAFGVAGFVLNRVGASPVLIFVFSALGLIPLADLIGEATEELALYLGSTRRSATPPS